MKLSGFIKIIGENKKNVQKSKTFSTPKNKKTNILNKFQII